MKKLSYCYFLLILASDCVALIDAHNLHTYFIANYHQFGGHVKDAYNLYKELLVNEKSLYPWKGYTRLLSDTNNPAHIVNMAQELEKAFSQDPDILFIIAQAFERTGNKDEADKRFITLNDQFKSNQEIAFNAANTYMRRKEPVNAIKVIDALLNNSPRKPNNFIFHFMKAQIYIQVNNKEQALKSVQKALEMHPRFDKGWLLYALLHEKAGELENAIKGYASFLEISPGTNRDVEQHLMQLIFKQKIAAQKGTKAIVLNKQCFEKALQLFEQKKYKEALEQINNCLAEKPNNNESKLLKIQILSAMNQPEKAADFIKRWILTEPTTTLWFKTLHLLVQTNLSIEYAIKILHDIEKQCPDNLLVTLYLADLYTRSGHNHSAMDYHKKSFDLSHDDQLKAKILFQLGLLHFQENTLNNMASLAQLAQQLKTSYPPLLNLVSYYYATQGNDLTKAQTLFDQLPKSKLSNPHYLDTQAVIYLRKKEHSKAMALLEKIAKKAPGDYTILIHLATAYHESGNKDLSLKILKQAQAAAKTINEKRESESLANLWNQHTKRS